jgi:hypothetical protein
MPNLRESGGSTLRGKLEARVFMVVCVDPSRLGGLRGKQITPSIGWEVLVRSRRSMSGSDMKNVDVIKADDKAKVRSFIL